MSIVASSSSVSQEEDGEVRLSPFVQRVPSNQMTWKRELKRMIESGSETVSPRAVDLEGFFTNTWPSNRNVKLIPATVFLNNNADTVSSTGKSSKSDKKKSKRQNQPKAPVARQDKKASSTKVVKVQLGKNSPCNNRLRNNISMHHETSTTVTEESKEKKARAHKRRGSAANEDEDESRNKKPRSEVTSGGIQSTGSSSETNKSARGSKSNKGHSANKTENRETKGEKNIENGTLKASKVGELLSERRNDSLELKQTPNKEKEKSGNNETEILKDILNQDCNSSMVLRSKRRRYWGSRFYGESDLDETWVGSAKKNKKKQTKKNDTANRKPGIKAKSKKNVDDKENNKRETQKSGRSLAKAKKNDDDKENNNSKAQKSGRSRAKTKKIVDDDKENNNSEAQKSGRSQAKAKKNVDDDKENNNSEAQKSGRSRAKTKKIVDDEKENNNSEAQKSGRSQAKAKKNVDDDKENNNSEAQKSGRSQAKAKKNVDDDRENNISEAQKSGRGRAKKLDKDEADDTNLLKKAKINIKPTDKKTKEEKKTANGGKKKAAPQAREEEVLKPEDCVITAKQGTLKYLKQRQQLVKALAREAEEEDDFFSSKEFGRKANIGKLVLAGAQDDTLSVKTPQGKGQPTGDCVITPRMALMAQWGVTEQRSTVYTPTTSSPVEAVSLSEKKAIMGTIYHHLKSKGKRPRGFRRQSTANSSSLESVFQNAKKLSSAELPALPEIPDLNDGDSSHDDYFNESDAY